MSNFNFNPDDAFAPVDVAELGLTGEPTATFSLSSAEVTGDGTATFNLTPSGDADGITFNLTPVLSSPEQPQPQPQQPQQQQFAPVPELDLATYREVPGHVITFSPTLQMSPSGGLTPDFTGLLPPPPPSVMLARATPQTRQLVQASSQPAPLTQVISSPRQETASPVTTSSFVEPYEQQQSFSYQKSSNAATLGISSPPSSQLSLLLQSPPQRSPPQYRQPPPPYKSPTYPTTQSPTPLLLSPGSFPPDNVLRIAPSVTLTKKPRPQASPQTPSGSTSSAPNSSPHEAGVVGPKLQSSPLRSPQLSAPASHLTSTPQSSQQISVLHHTSSPESQRRTTSPRAPHFTNTPFLSSVSPLPNIVTAPKLVQSSVTAVSPRAGATVPSSPLQTVSTPPPVVASSSPAPAVTPAPKLPSYSLEELKDLPGVNLKKNSVDLNTYVNAVAKNMHPHFANIDSYAERCLACIVRKIRSNLPTLKALEDITGPKGGDPGCILVPRMKDGRITIARPGGGAGGTKKIHPHLALVQIFKDPSVVNHNALVSTAGCSSPFQGGGDVVCISPLHYQVEGKKTRPQITPKKRNSAPDHQLDVSDHVKHQLPNYAVKPGFICKPDRSSVDTYQLLSDSDDDIDWVEKWNTESVVPKSSAIQEFNEEEILKQIEFLCLKPIKNGKDEYAAAEEKMIQEMGVREDLLKLLKGKFNLEGLRDAIKPRELPVKSREMSKPIVKRSYNRKSPATSKSAKKKSEAWVSEPRGTSKLPPTTTTTTTTNITVTASHAAADVAPPAVIKTEEDETVIQSLLDDIKGSFESQFEMDLDPFGASVGPAFSSQDFGISSSFNLANFDDDSLSLGSSGAREIFNMSSSSQAGGVASVSSDAMFSGVGGIGGSGPPPPGTSATTPGLSRVAAPSEGVSWVPPATEPFTQAEYLAAESISQEQFLKMFDDEN